jgi:photosystem II stability/assembly factor-like uncharacterized protein
MGVVLAALALCTGSPNSAAQVRLTGVAPGDALFDVAMVGRDVWVVGFPGILLHSSDGGASFAPQGSVGSAALLAVDFAEAKVGWIAGRGGLILATRDGGTSWEKQATGTNEPLLGLDFLDASNGMAVGNFAAAVRTVDGGKTWAKAQVAPEGEDPSLNAVAFVTKQEIVVAGEGGVLYHTADGGTTWEAVDAGTYENLNAIDHLGNGVLLAVGANGTILVSEDGGKSFAAVESGTRQHLFRVTHGAGRVLVTGNFGTVLSAESPKGPFATWTAPTFFWLSGARLQADGSGFLVGARSKAFTTADGGRTWKLWGEP